MRTLLLFLSCLLGYAAGAQQVRIAPNSAGGGSSLYPLSFEVVSPGNYLVAGQLMLVSDGYTEKGILFECSMTAITWSNKLNSTFSCNEAIVASNGDRIEFGQKAVSSGLPDACVSRWDSFGTLLWSVTLSTALEETMQAGIEAPDGSIYAVGKRRISGYFQTFLVRLSGAGTLLWARQDDSTPIGDQIPGDVFWNANTVLVFGQECVGAAKDFFIRAYDVNGNELLHKRFGSPSLNETIPSVTKTPDGGYVLYSGIYNDIRTAMVKLDAAYQLVPASSYVLNRPGGVILATSVASDTDGSLYLGGAVVGAGGYYGSVTKFVSGAAVWTSVLNSNGPVAAKVGFEGPYVVVPSVGFSASVQGLIISHISKASGTIMGIPCEPLNDASVIVSSEYIGLAEQVLISSTMDPGFTPVFGQTVIPYTPDMDDCGIGSLPIELLSWQALPDGNVVRLSWVTASEQNNDHFTVERSSDGVAFTEVVRVNGAWDSSIERRYEAVDEHPVSGISYYRLRQTDGNGTQSVSSVVVVQFHDMSTVLCRRGMPVRTTEPSVAFDQAGRHVHDAAYEHVFDCVGVFVLRGEATTTKVLVTD